jgi:hypothetical protein
MGCKDSGMAMETRENPAKYVRIQFTPLMFGAGMQ